MLTSEVVEALLSPISEALPCGPDLEYDPAFTALASAAQGKPEQQFGDTVIPPVEPDWRGVSDQARLLLGRAKDVRPGVLLLRAATRQQGVAGFGMGLDLLTSLLDRYWSGIHPMLDADDGDDPTARLNALAPLWDETMVLRDLLDTSLGQVPGVGAVTVRDVVMATHPQAGVGSTAYTAAQIEGALAVLHERSPGLVHELQGIETRLGRLQALVTERTERPDAVDLGGLRSVASVIRKASGHLTDGATGGQTDPQSDSPAQHPTDAVRRASAPGEIRSRQDALQTLDRVIHYLQQAEPGNPAPLLIARAKKLIGVSFLEIMADLAPNALDTIETVTGKPTVE